MDEHEVERLAKAMGARAAEQLDVERLASAVVARLRADRAHAEGPKRAWRTGPLVLRLAAALAVLLTGGILVRGTLERNGSPPTAMLTAPILRDLSADELAEVFDSLAIEAPVHEGMAFGVENLDEAQLKELLRLMEG